MLAENAPSFHSSSFDSYLNTSSIEDLSYVPPNAHTQQDTHQPVITGRKTWKILKEKKEAVWPPYIEAALFDALEKYRPASNGDTRLLRRFPKRNRFIAEHIFKLTGKCRTPKQVGSRLQQLRDTCREERILNLLSRREFPPLPPQSPHETIDPFPQTNRCGPTRPTLLIPSPTPSTQPSELSPFSPLSTGSEYLPSTPGSLGFGNSYFTYGAVEPRAKQPPKLSVSVDLLTSGSEGHPSHSDKHCSPIALLPDHQTSNQYRMAVSVPGPLWASIPNVRFTSSQQLHKKGHYSLFRVYVDGTYVHSEATDLHELPVTGPRTSSYAYGTQLIPRFWMRLSKTDDLSQCVVTQDIMTVSDFSLSGLPLEDRSILSIVYNFETHTCPGDRLRRPPPPPMVSTPPQLGAPLYMASSSDDPPLPPGFPDMPLFTSPIPMHHHSAISGDVTSWEDPRSTLAQPAFSDNENAQQYEYGLADPAQVSSSDISYGAMSYKHTSSHYANPHYSVYDLYTPHTHFPNSYRP